MTLPARLNASVSNRFNQSLAGPVACRERDDSLLWKTPFQKCWLDQTSAACSYNSLPEDMTAKTKALIDSCNVHNLWLFSKYNHNSLPSWPNDSSNAHKFGFFRSVRDVAGKACSMSQSMCTNADYCFVSGCGGSKA